jgi:phospholipid-binding lipoprotein MlaA
LKPAAVVYSNVVPGVIQTGVGNFFGNLGDVWTGVNNILQGKVADGVSDLMRVSLNSTFGLFGLFDIGSEAGMPKHREDFGQTLGVWGVGSGPYVVLPIFGPSTLRDSLAFPIDMSADPMVYFRNGYFQTSGSILRVVDQRAALLDASNLLEEAAFDRYAFVRDAYMQRRESTIRDGGSIKSSYQDEARIESDANAASPQGASVTPPAGPAKQAEPSLSPMVTPLPIGTQQASGASPQAAAKN